MQRTIVFVFALWILLSFLRIAKDIGEAAGQLLLWIGSGPFLTVLLFDWLGSNVVIEGAGANSSCDCKSSIATPFTTRAIRASGDCLWSHLRARSLLLWPETMHGWEAKIPTQTKTKNPRSKVKKLIMSIAMKNLEEQKLSLSVWSKEEKVVVCLKLYVFVSYFLLLIAATRIMLQFIYLLWDLEV